MNKQNPKFNDILEQALTLYDQGKPFSDISGLLTEAESDSAEKKNELEKFFKIISELRLYDRDIRPSRELLTKILKQLSQPVVTNSIFHRYRLQGLAFGAIGLVFVLIIISSAGSAFLIGNKNIIVSVDDFSRESLRLSDEEIGAELALADKYLNEFDLTFINYEI